ncbi:MAG: PAS domain S-box protein [Desulfobacterales bacterium]|nr:PAS domain S-box protein [Desulfobacterales bacterium]
MADKPTRKQPEQKTEETEKEIAELRRLESGPRQSEERYRFLVEESHDLIWTFDLTTMTFTYCSKSVETLLGYSQDSVIGFELKDVFTPETKKKVISEFDKVVKGKADKDRVFMEAEHFHRQGGAVWLEINAVLHRDSSGRPVSFTGISRDITERKKAEQEKEKLYEQLRNAQKMEAIGTLAGGIAHDFNNILSSVIGYTELSIDEIEKGTQLHKNLSRVLEAGNRAKDLVKQILAINRSDEQEFRPVPIIPLIKEVLKMLRSIMPASIEFRQNFPDQQLFVNANPTQVHQVIVNLTTNARDAMTDESGVLEVSVEPVSFDHSIKKKYPDLEPGNYAGITVSDTGLGIPRHFMDKIFEPYFTTRHQETGTGLGLSIVHGIVKAHKGHVTVCSEPGKGSTFRVYLPLTETHGIVSPPPEAEQELQTGTESILLVDDEKAIAEMQQHALERLGYKVTSKTGSRQALETFSAAPDKFDIMISDMTMPDMAGDRLAIKVKEIRPDLPVILCTGFSRKLEVHKEKLDVEDFLMKPVNRTEMAKKIRQILDRKKS